MPRVVIEGMSAEEVAELVRRLGGDVAITVTESAVGNKTAAMSAGHKSNLVPPGRRREPKRLGRKQVTMQVETDYLDALDELAFCLAPKGKKPSRADALNLILGSVILDGSYLHLTKKG